MLDPKYTRLLEERKRIEAELIEMEKEGRVNAIAEIKEHIAAMKILPTELYAAEELKIPTPPLFVNPENENETWTTRGHEPAWFVKQKAIVGLEAMLIKDDEEHRKRLKKFQESKAKKAAPKQAPAAAV